MEIPEATVEEVCEKFNVGREYVETVTLSMVARLIANVKLDIDEYNRLLGEMAGTDLAKTGLREASLKGLLGAKAEQFYRR